MKTLSTHAEIIHISPQDFLKLSPQPVLIDVRFSPEYQIGHAPNAVNLSLPKIIMGNSPLFQWLLPSWFKKLKKEQAIAVICLTAHRSPLAAKELVKYGFSQKIYNITGGMVEWQKLGLKIEKK
jgi:rhodanese-related sulfurtransferase